MNALALAVAVVDQEVATFSSKAAHSPEPVRPVEDCVIVGSSCSTRLPISPVRYCTASLYLLKSRV